MNKEEQFLIRLTVEEKAKLKELAHQENTTMAKLIKSRVFGLKSESIHKDFKKELVDINKKLFLLLDNAVKGNKDHDQIIELLSLMTSGENTEPDENKNSIFDYLLNLIQKDFIEDLENEIYNTKRPENEKDQFRFAVEQFKWLCIRIEKLEEQTYPNA